MMHGPIHIKFAFVLFSGFRNIFPIIIIIIIIIIIDDEKDAELTSGNETVT